MKKTFITLFLITTFSFAFSQKIITIAKEKVCETPKKTYGNITPIENFKESLTIHFVINKASLGTDVTLPNLKFSEVIRHESSIFEITKDMAISVSIGKVTEMGKNYYIYKIHLLKRIKDCWEDAAGDINWTKFNLGNITAGYAYGNEGTSGYIGFTGSITVE
jgi:hypothetical protein